MPATTLTDRALIRRIEAHPVQGVERRVPRVHRLAVPRLARVDGGGAVGAAHEDDAARADPGDRDRGDRSEVRGRPDPEHDRAAHADERQAPLGRHRRVRECLRDRDTERLRRRFPGLVDAGRAALVTRWCEWVDGVLRGQARPEVLVHGDLHPGNVLMTARGPMVIDWLTAALLIVAVI